MADAGGAVSAAADATSLLVAAVAAVVAAASKARGGRPGGKRPLPVLAPPLNFSVIESHVYRGGYPVLSNFRYLTRLKLRTVVSLVPEEPTQDLKDFCQHNGLHLMYIQAEKFKEAPVLMAQEVNQVLEAVINPDFHPLYMHCLDGGHNTGQVVIALRKLQRWENTAIIDEHDRWVHDEVSGEEMSCIEEFHHPVQLALPQDMPRWLWEGRTNEPSGQRKKHKLFPRLKYPDPIGTPAAGAAAAAAAASQEAPDIVVGTLDTFYDLDTFVHSLEDKHKHGPLTAKPSRRSCLWARRAGPLSVTLTRPLQSLWLDVGPAAMSVIEAPRALPQAASSYSDLSTFFNRTP